MASAEMVALLIEAARLDQEAAALAPEDPDADVNAEALMARSHAYAVADEAWERVNKRARQEMERAHLA